MQLFLLTLRVNEYYVLQHIKRSICFHEISLVQVIFLQRNVYLHLTAVGICLTILCAIFYYHLPWLTGVRSSSARCGWKTEESGIGAAWAQAINATATKQILIRDILLGDFSTSNETNNQTQKELTN